MRTAPKTVLFVAAIAVAAGLTGCSGAAGGGGGQSVADACKVIQEQGSAITSKAQEAMSSAASDPDAAVDALGDIQDEFETLGDKITNDEVQPVFSDFIEAYGELTDVIGAVAEDPANASDAMSKMSDATTKVTEAGKAMSEVCS